MRSYVEMEAGNNKLELQLKLDKGKWSQSSMESSTTRRVDRALIFRKMNPTVYVDT